MWLVAIQSKLRNMAAEKAKQVSVKIDEANEDLEHDERPSVTAPIKKSDSLRLSEINLDLS